ncbi:MAG: glycosyltransferase, partial [Lentisphaeria bacterium]|nr:glycosyltransferase [Lentisphaeria bacterium]
ADPEQLRVILVDNGSGDDSLEVFASELPEAEVVALPANLGFAKAANAGLRRVREPYALVLNTDIAFHNDAVTILTEALEADPRAVLACPRLVRPDGSPQAAAVPEPRLFWELVNRSLPRHLLRLDRDTVQSVPGVVGPCMAFHMERLTPIGFFDERFFFFMEETDLCTRIGAAGGRVLYVPMAEVMHMQGETANRRPIRARVQFYSSRYRYFRKHTGVAGVAVLYAGLWLRLTLDLVLHAVLTAATLGRGASRDRLAVYARLWLWHLLLCRPYWGFEPRPEPGADYSS